MHSSTPDGRPRADRSMRPRAPRPTHRHFSKRVRAPAKESRAFPRIEKFPFYDFLRFASSMTAKTSEFGETLLLTICFSLSCL